MKKKLLLIGILLTMNSCSQKDEPTLTPIEQLPKATKTGANTAGCLVNGKAFLPKGSSPSGNLICFYINQKDFSLDIYNNSGDKSQSINIVSKNIEIQINEKYLLKKKESNSQYGEFIDFKISNYYSTTPEINGELTITHHDYNNAIISGTFWFDAVNNTGEKIEVREGRFDMEY
jgi:hypothetical protein